MNSNFVSDGSAGLSSPARSATDIPLLDPLLTFRVSVSGRSNTPCASLLCAELRLESVLHSISAVQDGRIIGEEVTYENLSSAFQVTNQGTSFVSIRPIFGQGAKFVGSQERH